MSGTLQRKYVLTRLGPGDYVLPSNDGETLWRIARYLDGPSMGLDLPRDREFWGVWKWTGEPGQYAPGWANWQAWDHSGHETRQAAIDAAIGA